MKKDRLGRGLGALLGDYGAGADEGVSPDDVRKLALKRIVPNPHQPRKKFPQDELDELMSSIAANGLLQPLVVRPSPVSEGRYEIVAGERRFRSIQKLGWDEVPVVVRDVDDETLLVLALVENLQREALNPIEEAEGYQALGQNFDLTQAEIAKAVGKSRSAVANAIRLLRLPASLRKFVDEGQLSAGHARALLGLDDSVRMAELGRTAVSEGWSVRTTEKAVSKEQRGSSSGERTRKEPRRDALVEALERALQERLSTRARIKGAARGKGTIEIPFHGTQDFERLFEMIAGVEASDVVS
ncbi:MAG TPA: ParB/RepB/Spo0J family partition protein [Longimicrobiales bacterium]|nr:ParB/RepB/Spo0J family partition protein [Longimicrobiales bacterium]